MARLQTATQTGPGSTRWFKMNPHVTPVGISVQVGFGGAAGSVNVEVTLDETDPTVGTGNNSITGAGPAFVAPVAVAIATLTADGIVSIQNPVAAVRATVTAGASPVLVRAIQAGLT